MSDALDEVIGRTRTFLERARTEQVHPQEFADLIEERERLLHTLSPDQQTDDFSTRLATLRTLDAQLQRWAEDAQHRLARQLTQSRRQATATPARLGRIVIESA